VVYISRECGSAQSLRPRPTYAGAAILVAVTRPRLHLLCRGWNWPDVLFFCIDLSRLALQYSVFFFPFCDTCCYYFASAVFIFFLSTLSRLYDNYVVYFCIDRACVFRHNSHSDDENAFVVLLIASWLQTSPCIGIQMQYLNHVCSQYRATSTLRFTDLVWLGGNAIVSSQSHSTVTLCPSQAPPVPLRNRPSKPIVKPLVERQ